MKSLRMRVSYSRRERFWAAYACDDAGSVAHESTGGTKSEAVESLTNWAVRHGVRLTSPEGRVISRGALPGERGIAWT
jgi:hypothetical protein